MSRKHRQLVALALLVTLCAGFVPERVARAESRRGASRPAGKVSAALSELRRRSGGSRADQPVSVILQLNTDKPGGQLNGLLNRNGVRVRRVFRNLKAVSVELPLRAVEELAAYDEVRFVSADAEVRPFGHVSHTTGADDARESATAVGLNQYLDGSGVGIAVLDSGVWSQHASFYGATGKSSRVVVSVDFTGEGRTDDPFGHGTHVASAAAGGAAVSKGKYLGIAPNASLISLRVLNSRGVGTASGLLAAVDWLLANHAKYNVRVVNLSLGMPAVDSYRDDPLCRAVRRLADAGLVVFAAAGNDGKDERGRKIYGRVHSPGNEPSAVTVGAVKTAGTDFRGDDVVATFSSRGPTRSFWTDEAGVRHYDNLLKPDLVAPGNRLAFAEAKDNLLVMQSPHLYANTAGKYEHKMMSLSGSSVATPIAAGAAALLLQANPRLTPNMVKMILMYTAEQLRGFNAFEQGAGSLNVEGAVRLARAVRTDLTNSTPVGAPLLATKAPYPSTGISYADTLQVLDPLTGAVVGTKTVSGVHNFTWAQGIILDHTYAAGADLITKYQAVYGQGALLSDGVLVGDGVIVTDRSMMSDGVLIGDTILTSSGLTLGEGYPFCGAGALLSDGVLLSDGSVMGDGVLLSDGIIMNDGAVAGDAAPLGYTAMMKGE